MIKFFRKIRQNMIKENKVSKYMLYAIGEIVLVVIGILIALSINNWNELRKQQISEKDVIAGIKNDLTQDKEYINLIINTAANKISAFNILNQELPELYTTNRKKVDSLVIVYFISQRTFYPISGSFQSAISGNEISKFKNKKFGSAVTKLYNSTYARMIDNGILLDGRWEFVTKKYSHERRMSNLGDMNKAQLSEFLDDLSFHIKSLNYYITILESTLEEIDQLFQRV
jgi:hypothetical protein